MQKNRGNKSDCVTVALEKSYFSHTLFIDFQRRFLFVMNSSKKPS